ncbi:MAG: hypothetical protein QG568_318 [Patescibacteria group bacterium]|nr:hypothetical protein [Patescibacteria group bacterium]
MNKIQKIASIIALSAVVIASSTYSYLLLKHNYAVNIPQVQVADVSRAIAELQNISLPESLCYLDFQIKALESDLQNALVLSNLTNISSEVKSINAEITKLQAEDKNLKAEIKKFADRVNLTTSPFGKAQSVYNKLIAEKTKLEKVSKLSATQAKRLGDLAPLINDAKVKLETERGLIEGDRQSDTDRRNRSGAILEEITNYKTNIKTLQDKEKSNKQAVDLLKTKLKNANAKKCASSGLMSSSTISVPSEKVSKFKDAPCVSNAVVADLNKTILLVVSDIKQLQSLAVQYKSMVDKNAIELKKYEGEVLRLAKLNPTDSKLAEAQKQYSDAVIAYNQIATTPKNDTRRSQLPALLRKRTDTNEALDKIAYNRTQYTNALNTVKRLKEPQQNLNKTLTDLNQAYIDYAELKNIGSSFSSKVLCENTTRTGSPASSGTTVTTPNNSNLNTTVPRSGVSVGESLDCGSDDQGEANEPVQCPSGSMACSQADCLDTNYVCSIEDDESNEDADPDTVGSGWTISGSIILPGKTFSFGACTAEGECNVKKGWSETYRSEDLSTRTINCQKTVFEICKSPDGSRMTGREVPKPAVCYQNIPRIGEGR